MSRRKSRRKGGTRPREVSSLIYIDNHGPFYYPSHHRDSGKRGNRMDENMEHDTSLQMDESFEALLCYSFGWVTGIVFLVMEKNSKFVRFHALQSLLAFAGLSVAMIILATVPRVGFLIISFLWLAGVALWAVLMWKAFRGEWFRLPFIGNFARNFVNKSRV
jgi:uncharacterized membrane protein